MARPQKEGLIYANIDLNIFDDIKFLFISDKFQEKGELIAIKLLLSIYENGYYREWTDEVSMLFAKKKFNNCSFNLVNSVVEELVKRNFFNEDMFNRFNILTSTGIQRRWLKIVTDAKRKCRIKEEYNLLLPEITEETTAKQELTTSQREETTSQMEESTQSKVKNSKVKESKKEKEVKIDHSPVIEPENILLEQKTNINEVIGSCIKPYISMNDEFKKLYSEKQYIDYQWFVKLLTDNDQHFSNLFRSNFQVTLKQHKDLLSKYTQSEMIGGLRLLCGREMKPDFVLVHKICEYIQYFNRNEKPKSTTGKNEASYTTDHEKYTKAYGEKRNKSNS